MAKEMKNVPVKRARSGAVSGAVYSNKAADGRTYDTVTIDRSFRDKDGNWQSTNSYRRQDMSDLRDIAEEMEAYLQGREQGRQEAIQEAQPQSAAERFAAPEQSARQEQDVEQEVDNEPAMDPDYVD